MKQCLVCGHDFKPKNPKGVYCSSICRQKDYRRRIAEVVELGRKATGGGKNASSKPTLRTINPVMPEQSIALFNAEHSDDQNISIEARHRLWKETDPVEGTMSFMMKYDCSSYEELELKIKNKT